MFTPRRLSRALMVLEMSDGHFVVLDAQHPESLSLDMELVEDYDRSWYQSPTNRTRCVVTMHGRPDKTHWVEAPDFRTAWDHLFNFSQQPMSEDVGLPAATPELGP